MIVYGSYFLALTMKYYKVIVMLDQKLAIFRIIRTVITWSMLSFCSHPNKMMSKNMVNKSFYIFMSL